MPVLLATLTVCAGVGCAGVEPAAEPPATTRRAATTTSSSTTPPRTSSHLLSDADAVLFFDGGFKYSSDEQRAIRASVRAEQATAVARLAPVDPNLGDLAATVTGRELAARQRTLTDLVTRGQAHTEPRQVFRITIAKVTPEAPNRYLVESCLVSDAHPYEVASGRPLEPEGPAAAHMVNAMERQGDAWKLELSGTFSVSPGALRCPRFPSSTVAPSTLPIVPQR